jgi:L-cysteine:1D-myo-inositol 2-amino-2-deoxy-alpha-D-glucopyranoside ligase
VRYQGEKMSKSLGNLVLVSDVLDSYNADTLRLYLLSNHYRTDWEFVDGELERWSQVAADLREAADFPGFGSEEELNMSAERDLFLQAMEEDLNIPDAIEALVAIGQGILEAPEEDDVRDAQQTLRELADVLGLALVE